MIGWSILGVLSGLAVLTVFLGVFRVEQQERFVIERFGKFLRIAEPGINFKLPFVDMVARTLNLWLEQYVIKVEVKTRDNAFVTVVISVQRKPIKDKLYEATYSLDDEDAQIESYVKALVISSVSKMALDEVFEKRDETAGLINETLNREMAEFGWEIAASQITGIHPSDAVVKAMNDIVASEREKVAASYKGEAKKIMVVKEAEAEMESNILHGKGIAGQRLAITEGMKKSIEEMQQVRGGTLTEDQIVGFITAIQYFDTMKAVGTAPNSTVLFLPSGANAVADTLTQVTGAMLAADRVPTKPARA